MLITLEDETGIANLIVWAPVFERHRHLIPTAGMIGVRGWVQRQGLVVHLLVDRLDDLTALLRRVGDDTDGDAAFSLLQSRGDEARGGGRDQRDPTPTEQTTRDQYVSVLSPAVAAIRVQTRNFR